MAVAKMVVSGGVTVLVVMVVDFVDFGYGFLDLVMVVGCD